MKTEKAIRISCLVYQTISDRITEALRGLGIAEVHIQSGRVVVLKERAGFLGIGAGETLDEEPSELFSFFVREGTEERVMKLLIEAGELGIPGRGSIIAEPVEITSSPEAVGPGDGVSLLSGLAGITCIVQRGQGNGIIRAALDMGFSVPNITYGEGTGLRDKLGLLRITIPAEKEVVHLTVSDQDVDEVMNLLIDAGKLDQPGKGFIYSYPVMKGILDTKLFRGKQKHAASIEQLISAIDDIRGTTEWRRRSAGEKGKAQSRKFLSDLVNFTIVCNEGNASDLVRAAMDAGAAGATISKLKFLRLDGEESSVSPAREMSDLVVSGSQVDAIAKAMEDAGAFDAAIAGAIEIKRVSAACTYLGANR